MNDLKRMTLVECLSQLPQIDHLRDVNDMIRGDFCNMDIKGSGDDEKGNKEQITAQIIGAKLTDENRYVFGDSQNCTQISLNRIAKIYQP